MAASRYYLLAYNAAQFFGWTYIFAQTCLGIKEHGLHKVYPRVHKPIQIFQTLMILEIVHALLRFVRTPVATAAVQIFARLIIVWPVCYMAESTHDSIGIVLYSLAWSITEMIRYPFYFLALLDSPVHLITWLRYTLFIVLYPMGAAGEMLTHISGLAEIKKNKTLSLEMPNRLNFSFTFHYALVVWLLLYIPLFPKLYLYMDAQRKKVIGGEATKPKKA